ncbi:MAG TPA: UvrD-helicase domain-containing protein [Candidatus Paceibacterota bacterium]|nr:UvrD-helicase domain-containing protein [Candidatus Paceibacterota bacterium]
MEEDPAAELKAATDKALESTSAKKLVVAGPGSGKTYLFKKLLERAGGGADDRLVLTFVNSLKEDLERSLGDSAKVFTLHGYSQSLLHRDANLRGGLSTDFICYPGLRSFISEDWEILRGGAAPAFIALMRKLECSDELGAYYMERCDFYDAVDFDDGVYRVLLGFKKDRKSVPTPRLTLVDEFQDFNAMEAEVIAYLAEAGPIVLAGDDDQALYGNLRNASWDHIRKHYAGTDYEHFHLPFCMRCTQVIVDAVNEVLTVAKDLKKLAGRIEKPFRFYEPMKGPDSQTYPTIDLVTTSVQSNAANYIGRFIEERLRAISAEDIAEAEKNHEPVALIIGSKPYLPQVEDHLRSVGLLADEDGDKESPRELALKMLKDNPHSNLAWRIILSLGDRETRMKSIRLAAEKALSLSEVLPEDLRAAVLKEVAEFVPPVIEEKEAPKSVMNIQTRSYESAKGLTAQHVFLLGLQEGDLPRQANNVTDMEICKFLVGLTRTKKKCTIVLTRRFAGTQVKAPSPFLRWITARRFNSIKVDAAYWRASEARK